MMMATLAAPKARPPRRATVPVASLSCLLIGEQTRGLDSTRIWYPVKAEPFIDNDNNEEDEAKQHTVDAKRSRSLPCILKLLQDFDIQSIIDSEFLREEEEDSQAVLKNDFNHQRSEPKQNEASEADTTCTTACPRDVSQNKQKEASHHHADFYTKSYAHDRVLRCFQKDSCFSPSFFPSSTQHDAGGDLHWTLQRSEVRMSKTLGRGGFAEVREFSIQQLQQTRDGNCLFDQTRYAIKQVRRDSVLQAQNEDLDEKAHDKATSLMWAGMIDLAVETSFLRQLHHPHIIQLCGVARDESVFSPEYFVILDRLHDTLYTRIHQQWKPRLDRETVTTASLWWSLRKSGSKSSSTGTTNAARRSIHFLRHRLSVARDISSAIAYLHEKHVCHRDLKPCNVGFDVNGSIKVFDFGLARELPHVRCPDGNNTTISSRSKEVFRLTQMTGTLRFMAPEVAMGLPYNEQCDVYSFALIVWEMLTCTRPYAKLQTEKDFIKQVFEQGQRPKIPTADTTPSTRHFPASVMKACQDLLQGGWDADWSKRWTIRKMQATLESICTRLDESFSSSSSSSSSLQQHQQQQQEQQSSSCSRKQFWGRMIPVHERRMDFSNKKTSLFLSWPKRFLLPSHNKQLHPKRGPQSGSSSTKRDEESFVGEKGREKEEKKDHDNEIDDDDYTF